jgi:streptogramin lyase
MLTRFRVSIALAAGFGLLAMLFLAAGLAQASPSTGQETGLASQGLAYEANPDAQGNLWVSDEIANQIWHINAASGAYTVYQGLHTPTDAKPDSAGAVWWADISGGALDSLNVSTGEVTPWTIPGAVSLWGVDIDQTGRVWATDSLTATAYSFTPGTAQLCAYTLPDLGHSNYLLANNGMVWLGDDGNGRILRLDPKVNEFTVWQLDAGAYPQSMRMDGNANLWWADENLNLLGRLQPDLNVQNSFVLPYAGGPEMIALHGSQVWYSSNNGPVGATTGTVGLLYPATAQVVSSTLPVSTTSVTPTCQSLSAGTKYTPVTNPGTATWSDAAYPSVAGSGGWRAYQLPTGAIPWGVAVSGRQAFFTDQGRQKLIRLSSFPNSLYMPIVRKQ